MTEDLHPTVQRICHLFTSQGIPYESFLHDPVRTSAEAALVRTGYTLDQGAKSLIARVKKPGEGKKFIMFVVPGDKRFDPRKVKAELGFIDIRFATDDEVAEITGGVLPGGIPPFGNLFGLDIFVDTSLFNNEKIIFNAGDRRYSIGMRSEDYRKIASPVVRDIAL